MRLILQYKGKKSVPKVLHIGSDNKETEDIFLKNKDEGSYQTAIVEIGQPIRTYYGTLDLPIEDKGNDVKVVKKAVKKTVKKKVSKK